MLRNFWSNIWPYLYFVSNRWIRVALDGKSTRKYPVNAVVHLPQLPLYSWSWLFLLYKNYLFDDVNCKIVIYTDNTTLYSKCGWASDLWQQLEMAAELEFDLGDTMDKERRPLVVLLLWKWLGPFMRKYNFLRCWGWLSLLNWIKALTFLLLLKLHPKKLELSFFLWSFFLLRLLCISKILLYGLEWNIIVMPGLVLLAAT